MESSQCPLRIDLGRGYAVLKAPPRLTFVCRMWDSLLFAAAPESFASTLHFPLCATEVLFAPGEEYWGLDREI